MNKQNGINKAVEELVNQFVKVHFPGPYIVPPLAVEQLAAAALVNLRNGGFFFNGPPKQSGVVERKESGVQRTSPQFWGNSSLV